MAIAFHWGSKGNATQINLQIQEENMGLSIYLYGGVDLWSIAFCYIILLFLVERILSKTEPVLEKYGAFVVFY